MQVLPGFELAGVVWQTAGLVAYEARSVSDNARLLVLQGEREPDDEASAADPIARLHRVHEIIDAPGLVLEPDQDLSGSIVLGTFHWDDAVPLNSVLSKGELDLISALTLVRQCALLLDAIHGRHGVHGALSTRSILWSSTRRCVRLVDLAFVMLPELPYVPHPERRHHEILLFQAPEATGRTAHVGPEAESDLYSLGAILYRLTVGTPPFDVESPIELAHKHLAEKPVRPSTLMPDVPEAVSTVAMKLLEKLPEARYRTARSLADDLDRCISAIEKGRLHTELDLDRHVPPSRLRLPAALYGREQEAAQLLAAYEQQRAGGRGIVLVKGLSGVGKTALVDTLRRQAALDGAVFAAGKFPQQQSDQPFVGIAAALHDIVHYLLGLPHEQLATYRSRLLTELGSRLTLIADLVPELDIALGQELTRPDPPPGKEREWLVDACRRLIRQFTAPNAPLVLFIDDVHWMDEASRQLLDSLLEDEALEHFLLVLAYRTKEAATSEILKAFLDAQQLPTSVLELQALTRDDVARMLGDTVVKSDPPIERLAAALYSKTAGNPLFVRRLVESLHHQGDLYYAPDRRVWVWHEDAIRASKVSENVIEFLVSRLRSYDDSTLQLLHMLACMDGRQTLGALAEVCDKSPEDCASSLALPLSDGLLIRTVAGAEEAVYAFSHDRIEQAAYSITDSARLPEQHLQVAAALMKRQTRTSTTAFQIAAQLERAGEAAEKRFESSVLGGCYLDAAESAHHNAAYDAARKYVLRTLDYLNDDAWDEQYALTLRLNRLRAELRYQEQDFVGSRRLLHHAIEHCSDPMQRADLYALLIIQATLDGSHAEAISDGRSALHDLGFDLPSSGYEDALAGEMSQLASVDVNAEFDRLLNLPLCGTAEIRKIMDVLMVLIPPTFFLVPALNNFIAVMMTKLTLEHGVCPASPKGLVNYGAAIVEQGRYREGFLFGELAVQLADRHGFTRVKPRVLYTYAGGLNHWVNPLQSTPRIVDEGRALCTELGERDYEGYLLTLGRCRNEIFLGRPIDPFRSQVRDIIKLVTEVKNELGRGLAVATYMCLAHLSGDTDGPESFDIDEFTEKELLAATHENKTQLVDCFYFTLKAQNLYFLERFDAASKSIDRALRYADRLSAGMGRAVMPLLSGLIAVERALGSEDLTLTEHATKVLEEALPDMGVWASLCSHNFSHLEALLKGARSSIDGRPFDAVAHFSEAAYRASRTGFPQFEAMAHQNLARTWSRLGNGYYSTVHLKEARRCFHAWGARRLTAHEKLQERDAGAQTVGSNMEQGQSSMALAPQGESAGPASLDSAVLVSLMGRLSADIEDFEALKKDLTTIIAQASGASKAVLLMQRSDELSPVLSIETDQRQAQASPPTYPSSLTHRAARMRTSYVVESGKVQNEPVHDPYLAEFPPASALCTPLVHQGFVEGVLYVENRDTFMDLSPERCQLIEVLAAQAALSIRNAQLYEEREREVRERTKQLSTLNNELAAIVDAQKQELAGLSRIRRFLSPRVASYVEQEGGWALLENGRRDIAIIFCDLRNFTEFSSRSQPERQKWLQTEYRRCLDELFVQHDATVDHWEGDGAMVFIGAPEKLDPPTDAIPKAVNLALAMRESVRRLVAAWKKLDFKPKGFGIGITYGTCWVGLSGEGWRVDYNAGGAYVNLCARLCSAAGPDQILITNEVRSHMGTELPVTPMGAQKLKGISNPGEIYCI